MILWKENITCAVFFFIFYIQLLLMINSLHVPCVLCVLCVGSVLRSTPCSTRRFRRFCSCCLCCCTRWPLPLTTGTHPHNKINIIFFLLSVTETGPNIRVEPSEPSKPEGRKTEMIPRWSSRCAAEYHGKCLNSRGCSARGATGATMWLPLQGWKSHRWLLKYFIVHAWGGQQSGHFPV